MKSYYRYNTSYVKQGNLGRRQNAVLPVDMRTITLLIAIGLVCAALLFILSVSSSLFGVPNIKSPLGDFFADAYGVLSFIVPAYLLFAAFILWDKGFRPRLIFILNSILFPFITLAIGFSFMRDFDYHASRLLFFEVIGRNGFSLLVVGLTMLEGFIIYSLACIFFPPEVKRRHPKTARSQSYGRPQEALVLTGRTIVPAPPTMEQVKMEYAAAFDTLQEKMQAFEEQEHTALTKTETPVVLEPETEVPQPLLYELDANLEALNSRLEHLGNNLGGIDAQFSSLDSKIESIKDEMTELGIDAPSDLIELERVEDGELVDVAVNDAAFNLEEIFDEAQEQAQKKTAEVLREQQSDLLKKKIPLKRDYHVPVENILDEAASSQYWLIDETTKEAARILTGTLREFNIEAEVTGIRKGPVITSFEILPSPGVKLSKIVNLQDNIALRLAAASVRIVAPIPGKHAVGIEIPNKNRNLVSFREIIRDELQKEAKKADIPVVLGKDIAGEAVTIDLATTPHLLIAGSTGSGKSVCVNAMILSILYQCPPDKCRLILIDPKIVELKLYNDIPHLLTPVITEPKRAFQALQYCIYEMERRYACLDSLGVRDIKTYNKRLKERNLLVEPMPYIVVVIDEFADLMATTGKELESTVARLAAMSRAVGIHLVLATQRPSIDVITGLIKSNIPSRIAFMVASMTDSRIIIDTAGAEKLLGKGDMLYSGTVSPFPVRMQGAFVSEDEVERVVAYVKTLGEPDYIDEEIFVEDEESEQLMEYTEGCDPLYEKALEIVVQQGKASASYIQRRLKIGYNRAARLVEDMEHRGVVGPAQGSRPRELLRAV